jgi:Holliday junction DNA helicase RuvA
LIAGVRGRVAGVDPASVVMAVGPIDVRIGVPARSALRFTPGQEIELRTYLYVRENQLSLFGFRTDDELQLFELLLTVSGIGPKAALSILSTLEAEEVRRAIADDDPRTLARTPGVGLRAAARIVNDLQSKIKDVELERIASGPGAHADAMAALMAMGYSPAEAKSAVDRVSDVDSVESVLREALGWLAERS